MKRKYVLSDLLLVGLGVISTPSFSLGDLTSSSVAAPVQVTQGATAEHLDTVDVKPYLGSDGIYIKIGLSKTSNGLTLDIAIEDSTNPIDISGYTFWYKTSGSWTQISSPAYDPDTGAVTLPMTGIAFSNVKLRISSASSNIYANAVTLIIYETVWS
jgi:hypothetical protein